MLSIRKSCLILSALATLSCSLMASESHNPDHSSKASDQQGKASLQVNGTQKLCPIRGEAIDPEAYIDVQGQRIYFCCQGCDKKFLKDPDAGFSKLQERGELAQNVQKVCPISGEDLENKDHAIELPGRKVFACCKKCAAKLKANPEKYLKVKNAAE